MDRRSVEGRPSPDRELTLRAALELFLTNGYAATTVTAVAQAAQLNRATVSRLFPRKESFLGDILDALLAELDVLVEAVDVGRSAHDDAVFVLSCYLDALLRHRPSARLLYCDSTIRSTKVWERAAVQQRRLVARLAGQRAPVDQQVRANCSLSVVRLSVGELAAVPAHRLRRPLLAVAVETCSLCSSRPPKATVAARGGGGGRPAERVTTS